MDLFEEDVSAPSTWNKYLLACLKFLLIFYLASFCMGLLFIHRGAHWLIPGLILGLSYLAIIIVSAAKMIKKLPVSAILLAAPTIPLLMMILVVSLLPLLNFLDNRFPSSTPKIQPVKENSLERHTP